MTDILTLNSLPDTKSLQIAPLPNIFPSSTTAIFFLTSSNPLPHLSRQHKSKRHRPFSPSHKTQRHTNRKIPQRVPFIIFSESTPSLIIFIPPHQRQRRHTLLNPSIFQHARKFQDAKKENRRGNAIGRERGCSY